MDKYREELENNLEGLEVAGVPEFNARGSTWAHGV